MFSLILALGAAATPLTFIHMLTRHYVHQIQIPRQSLKASTEIIVKKAGIIGKLKEESIYVKDIRLKKRRWEMSNWTTEKRAFYIEMGQTGAQFRKLVDLIMKNQS